MSVFDIWQPTNVTLNNATVSTYGGQIYTIRWQLKTFYHPGPWWMQEYFKELFQGVLACWILGA